jgi:hypothetical protein
MDKCRGFSFPYYNTECAEGRLRNNKMASQFLIVDGFKAQILRSTLGPLETIQIALFGNNKTAF